MRSLIILAAAVASIASAETFVIQNATIWTMAKGKIVGSVVVKDGKIDQVGEKVMVPSGAKVIDAGGQHLIPGIIDAHSHIAAESINEGSVSVSSMVGIADVLNPDDIAIYRDLAGGVTAEITFHLGVPSA